jgi:hypothetical protein
MDPKTNASSELVAAGMPHTLLAVAQDVINAHSPL